MPAPDPTVRWLLSAIAVAIAAVSASLGTVPSGWRAGIAGASAFFGALGIIPPQHPVALTTAAAAVDGVQPDPRLDGDMPPTPPVDTAQEPREPDLTQLAQPAPPTTGVPAP